MAVPTPVRMAILMIAVVILVATRFPGDAPWSILAAVGGFLTMAFAAWSLSSRAPVGTRATAVILGLALLLVPTSSQAWFAGLPDVAAAILFVIALHVFFTTTDAGAPMAGQAAGRPWYQTLYRMVPAALATTALLAAPWLSTFLLPPRIHAAYELQTALQPVAFLTIIAAVLITGSLLWTALDRTDKPAATDSTKRQSEAASGGEA